MIREGVLDNPRVEAVLACTYRLSWLSVASRSSTDR